MGKIVILRATQYGLCYTGEEPIAPGEIIDGVSIIPDKKPESVFCCKCGKDITHENQIGAGDGTGQRFQCESWSKKETVKMKVSELKGTVNLHYIQCSCGDTWEPANGPRERRIFFEKHKDHKVKRFQVTSTVS